MSPRGGRTPGPARPRLSRALLRLLTPPDDDPFLLDDLDEEFAERARATSPRAARRWYRLQVATSVLPLIGRRLSLLRPGASVSVTTLDSLLQDLRFAVRSLVARPVFTAVAAVTIGLGVGANTALFGLVDAILLGPVPGVEDTRGLVEVSRDVEGAFHDISYPIFRSMGARVSAFESVAGFDYEPVSVGGDPTPATTLSLSVTAGYFDVLRVEPSLGRFFTASEARPPAAERVAVVSHHLWRSRLGSDPAVVGSTLRINGTPVTVVGVTRPGFRGHVRLPVDVFLPFGSGVTGATSPRTLADPEAGAVEVVARLAPGASTGAAAEATTRVGDLLLQSEAGAKAGAFRARVEPWGPIPAVGRGPVRAFFLVLATVGGLVLVVACVNVAGMLLSRAVERHGEIAIRRALGASGGRIVRQLLTESLVLFSLGGAVGIVLSGWLMRLLLGFDPPLPAGFELPLDLAPGGRVLGYALLLTLGAAVLFSLQPALRAARWTSEGGSAGGPGPDLAAGRGGRASGGTRARHLLVAGQMAGCVTLLVVAGLFLRSLESLETLDPGWNAEGVLTAELDLALSGVDDAEGRRVWRALDERLAALPGVESVGFASRLPLSGRSSLGLVHVPGVDPPPGQAGWDAGMDRVTPGFFDALEIEVEQGRAFGPEDGPDGVPVAVVNRRMAELLWPGESPLGRSFRVGPPEDGRSFTVVGVARNIAGRSLGAPAEPFYWLPSAQWYNSRRVVFIRTAGGGAEREPAASTGLPSAVRAAIHDVAPDLPVERVAPMEERLSLYLLPQRLAAWVTGVSGLLGLGLAAVGVYGMTAFWVGRQLREIGIRLALGARPGDEWLRVVRRGMGAPVAGTAVGLLLAGGAAGLAGRFLDTVSPADPVTWSAAVLTLLSAALLAAAIPAVRATRAAPMASLRME